MQSDFLPAQEAICLRTGVPFFDGLKQERPQLLAIDWFKEEVIGTGLGGLQGKFGAGRLCDCHKNQIIPQSAYLLKDLNRVGRIVADALQVENNPVDVGIIDIGS